MPESSLIESQVRCPHYHSLIYTYVLYLYIHLQQQEPKAFSLQAKDSRMVLHKVPQSSKGRNRNFLKWETAVG